MNPGVDRGTEKNESKETNVGQIIVRIATFILVIVVSALPVRAERRGVDATMPLVEKTLRFLRSQAIDAPPEAALLRAGALRVCGENFERPGCKPQGVPIPSADMVSPEATRAWRRILESAMVAESIKQKSKFDKVAFQRFVMDGMVEELHDPASFYLVPSVYRKIASIPSDFVGFGLRVVADADSLTVSAVHPGSPAKSSGLVLGDRISRVNDLPVTGYHRPLALAAIWGAEGEKVKLTVERGSRIRDIKIEYSPWIFQSYNIERVDEIVVVHVRHFERGLVDAVQEALAKPTKGIVFDLKGAASGDESEMVALVDMVLDEGPIGSKKARSDLGTRTWKARAGSPGEQRKLPATLVIDVSTSGLSEVFASALRQNLRALLVGKATGGNDTQETIRTFSDGSAIQVTSTRLFGPDETSLQKGVKPHLKTDRLRPVDLAVTIVKSATDSSLEALIEAGRKAVNP